jgi:formylglycine-generating enzyme required for sulfatase activity
MDAIRYQWTDDGRDEELAFIHVRGTHGAPYQFGEPPESIHVEIRDFFIGATPVTQAFWSHITGPADNPSVRRKPELPVENVSWDALGQPGGFLQRLNESPAAATLRDKTGCALEFRLPTETEWEYAARGGPHWRDSYRFSGSNEIADVAWYDRRHGDWTQPVARKAPNQLGIHDMSGNVWEWCQDTFSRDVHLIPTDGMPYDGPGDERVLRGGCFHNWAVHCTVSKRYEIAREFHDGCIGLRLVLAEPRSAMRRGT